MGTPAKANVEIIFDDKQHCDKVIKKITKFVVDANKKKLNGDYRGDYDIEIDSIRDFGIILNVHSGRVQNLEWQLEKIRDFVYQIPEVIEMDSNVWIQSEGPSFFK